MTSKHVEQNGSLLVIASVAGESTDPERRCASVLQLCERDQWICGIRNGCQGSVARATHPHVREVSCTGVAGAPHWAGHTAVRAKSERAAHKQ